MNGGGLFVENIIQEEYKKFSEAKKSESKSTEYLNKLTKISLYALASSKDKYEDKFFLKKNGTENKNLENFYFLGKLDLKNTKDNSVIGMGNNPWYEYYVSFYYYNLRSTKFDEKYDDNNNISFYYIN